MVRIDHNWTAWTLAGEQAIFLDLLEDRYFGLGEPENSRFRARIASGELAEWHLPTCMSKPEAWESPNWGPPVSDNSRLDIAGIAAVFWIQRRLERRLRTMPFHQFLIGIREMAENRLSSVTDAQAECIPGIVADFERARLIRSAANLCVPRSLAFVLRCAARGLRVHAVIGVKTKPFEAHCWAQYRSAVLTDPLEHVLQFKPILVI
jgi:Transglutaminase-like superfamily